MYPLSFSKQLPDPEVILPCYYDMESDGTLKLNCQNNNLGDSKMSDILNLLVNIPLGTVLLKGNNLTRIPDQFTFFDRLQEINLADNYISSIQPGTLFSPGVIGNLF